MNDRQKKALTKVQRTLFLELKLYFRSGGRDDEWLPEAISRAQISAGIKTERTVDSVEQTNGQKELGS